MTDRVRAIALFAALLAVYNANGREIGTYDSQPTKYAARELILRGTLALNYVVGATPQLAERPAFVTALDGRYRSAYSPVPAVAAATLTWPFWATGALDIRAPLGPNWIAKLAASILTAAASVLAFFTARRFMPSGRAFFLTAALGAGTGYWSTASQTLWQHETAIFGLALATFAFTASERRAWHLIALGLGLGLAGTSRPQLAPAVLVMLAGITVRDRWRALVPGAIAAACAAALLISNVRWYGSVLGAMPMLEALHPRVHATEGTFALAASGFAGLLIAPNRGLFVFSPIVLVAATGLRAAWGGGWRSSIRWSALAALAQYALYGCYAVWWGGNTYGPRYMLDVLPLLVPMAAAGIGARALTRPALGLIALLAAWSIFVAALGAFVFPHERWNLLPADVDRNHARLWSWTDMQIIRAWHSEPSPQNGSLFHSLADR